MNGPRSDRAGYLYSGIGVKGTATANTGLKETSWIDARGSEKFLRWYSGSADGGSAGASAIYNLWHTHDKVNFTLLETMTASASANVAGVATAVYSGGPYSWLTVSVSAVYSAAVTGTGHLFLHITPSPR